MRAGTLNRKISIERKTDTRDDHGQPIPVWTRIGVTRWAARNSVRGDERFTAAQFVARDQVEFQVRWTTDLEDLSPLDRIVYPVVTSPTNSEIYEIMAVQELGRRQGLKILTARRAET